MGKGKQKVINIDHQIFLQISGHIHILVIQLIQPILIIVNFSGIHVIIQWLKIIFIIRNLSFILKLLNSNTSIFEFKF